MGYGDPVIIEPQNSGPAPLTYKLAAGQGLEPLLMRADFDGSGAGGDFIPQVSFYAQDGRHLGSFPAPAKIAAGSSQGVTWFPLALPGDGTGSTGGVTAPNTERFAQVALVCAPGTTLYPFTHAGGVTLTTGGGATTPTVLEDGVYSLSFTVTGSGGTAFTAGRGFWSSGILLQGNFGDPQAQNGIYPGANLQAARIGWTVDGFLAAGRGMNASVVNTDTVNHTLQCVAYLSKNG